MFLSKFIIDDIHVTTCNTENMGNKSAYGHIFNNIPLILYNSIDIHQYANYENTIICISSHKVEKKIFV